MGLYEELRNLSEQIKKRQAHVKGEEATKQALVLPFLQVLGFDIYDPTEVKPEFVADFAKRKSNGQFEKIDYAVYVKGEPSVFLECKAVDVAVEDHDGQLARYFNSVPSVKLAVLTNGLTYRFFTDLRAPNVMDAVPFLEFNILRIAEREAELLRSFTKENFNSSIIQRHAEEIISFGKVTLLINDLLRNPSEKFIRFILGELDLVGGRVTANVVERFEPIIKKSMQTALLEMMTKSIQQEISPAPLPIVETPRVPTEKLVPVVVKVPLVEVSGSKEGIVTTEEELAAYRLICKICESSSAKIPVKYKDSLTFFAINLGSPRTWFLRLFTDGRKKAFTLRLPVDQVETMARGFQIEAAPEALGKSRIYFNSITEIEQLRPLILRAYEEAVRRQETGSSESEDKTQ